MITRKGLADEIDAIDASIKALNDSKSEAYKAYREQLEDTGMEPRRAAAEVAATKAAIIKRRKLAADPDAVAEKDDLIDTILAEIQSRPSRAREEQPSDSPKSRPGDAAASLTQQSNSPRQERPSAQERSSDRSGGQFGDAPKPAHIPHSSALPTVQADNAGEVAASPSASPAAIDADVPAFLLKERPSLRPLCQDPANCAGYGHKTCHRCLQAAGQSEAA